MLKRNLNLFPAALLMALSSSVVGPSPAAPAQGEAEIRRIGQRLRAEGRR